MTSLHGLAISGFWRLDESDNRHAQTYLTGLAREEYALAAEQSKSCGVAARRSELLDEEPRGSETVAKVTAIVAYMVPLSEMELAVLRRSDVVIFICAVPTLDQGYRNHQSSPRPEYAREFAQRGSVVHMLQDVVSDRNVEGGAGQVDTFEVQGKIRVARLEVGSYILVNLLGNYRPERLLRCEVQDLAAGIEDIFPLQGNVQQSVPLERGASWAFGIVARRMTEGPEPTRRPTDRAGSRHYSVQSGHHLRPVSECVVQSTDFSLGTDERNSCHRRSS